MRSMGIPLNHKGGGHHGDIFSCAAIDSRFIYRSRRLNSELAMEQKVGLRTCGYFRNNVCGADFFGLARTAIIALTRVFANHTNSAYTGK